MNYPTMSALTFEDAAEYAIEALGLIGAPLGYEDKISNIIKIKDYKALLPINLVEVRGVKMDNGHLIELLRIKIGIWGLLSLQCKLLIWIMLKL